MTDPITVSYSELDTYRQCPLKWFWGYQQLWTAEKLEGSALYRGSSWHDIMEIHYTTIMEMRVDARGRFKRELTKHAQKRILDAAWVKIVNSGNIWDPVEQTQTEEQALLEWMYKGHVEAYGLDVQWQILAVERADSIPLLDLDGNESRYHLKHKLDLVIIDLTTGQLKVVDHKSAADFSRDNEIDIDDQFGLYSWAWWRRTGDRPISVIRSDARTRRNKKPMTLDERFRRVQTFRSDKELDQLARDAFKVADAAYTALERGDDGIYSSPNPRQCTWKCDFLDAHIQVRKHPRTKVATIMGDFGFKQREAKHQQYTVAEGQS